MIKSLVWECFQGMSKRDRSHFLRFIESPYFNRREDLIRLTHFLLQDDILNNETLTKEVLFAKVYPEEPKYDSQMLRLQLSYLQKHIEFFFSVEELSKDGEEASWLMLAGMKRRNLPKNYKKKLKYFRNKSSIRQDWAYHFGQYRLELQNLELIADTSGKEKANYEVLADSLDYFYLSSKLHHICSAILYHSVFDSAYQFPKIDLILDLANQEKFLSKPTISIYYYFIKVMTGEEVFFEKIKHTLFSHQEEFSVAEFHDIYKMILNFYIRKINEKSISYIPEALAFYKKGLELDLLVQDNHLSRFTYSNIVAAAIKERDMEWVSTFIESYKPMLRKKVRKETYSLNKARLEYSLKNHDEALAQIANVNYKELFPNITARLLQIKIYWECDELDLLDTHLHSLKFLLRRRKVAGYHLKVMTNVINYTRKLAEVNPYDAAAVEKLRKNIEAEENLMEKDWLLEQLHILNTQK